LSPLSERAKEVGVALDPALDPWFARALALAPQERFRSAGEMARELGALADLATARGGGGPRSMPGIAAAIAQPLVFQPEPSPASLGLAATAPAAPSPLAAPAAQATRAPAAATLLSEEPIAGVPKKGSSLPLLLGIGVVLCAGLAFAGYEVFGKSGNNQPGPEPSASAATSPAPSARPVAALSGPARARFSCQPAACEWVVCDGKNVAVVDDDIELSPGNHDCSASKNGFGSKSVTFTAAPGQVSAVVFELPPLPANAQQKAALANPAAPAKTAAVAPKPAPPAEKPAAAKPTAAAKPAAAPAATKPAATKPKKKCSTFLGCK
jgi:hypothetical protein